MKIWSDIKPNPTMPNKNLFCIWMENDKGDVFSCLIDKKDLDKKPILIRESIQNLLWQCYPDEMKKDFNEKNYLNLLEGRE